ncbi:MAG: polysaccharide deacetylase family protein [bacterium]|nr:polysaccharide deacetylase family protein [bacterium]
MTVLRTLRATLLYLLLVLARTTDRWRRGGIPFFIYHSLDDSGSQVSISPVEFNRQIAYLRTHQFEMLPASRAIESLGRPPSAGRRIVLTFDDACTSIRPCIEDLLRHGGGTTVFVPTNCMGATNLWDQSREDIRTLAILSADEIHSLHQQGCEFGSHTASHAKLTELTEAQAFEELAVSKAELERLLNRPAVTVAYPYGAYNPSVVKTARSAGFQAGFTTVEAEARPNQDPLQIPRFSAKIEFLHFQLIAHRGYHWYLFLQRWAYRLVRGR